MAEPSNSTELSIAAMTDAGEFERLATSTLRVADPLYKGIVHTGVNPIGQTVTDPLDGISICRALGGQCYAIACEHTITARANLREKWLDPNNGDLFKAVGKLTSFRDSNPEHKLRLVLTSKNTPSSDLVQEAHSQAARDEVELEIWSSDKLANILDINPDGQYIRSKYFGSPQTRLSRDLAIEISQKHLIRHAPLVPSDQLILRETQSACPAIETISSPVIFLNGSSGSGKSAFCHQICNTLVNDGGLAFVVTHNALEKSSSLGQAIRKSLAAEIPSLNLDDPVGDIIRVSEGREVQIWIEDINLSTSPTDLISKLNRSAGELSGSKDSSRASKLRVLCPLWPENLRSLPTEMNKAALCRTVDLTDFSDDEAREAIKRRSFAAGFELTNVEADVVRERLGNDPLLIGLWKGEDVGKESEVLSSYVNDALSEASQSSTRSVFSLRRSVQAIASWMLENRTNEPSFEALHADFDSSDVFSDMESICSEGRLFREVLRGGQVTLGFRHDRVRDALLIGKISNTLSTGEYSHSYLLDPYYSKLVAQAAIKPNTPEEFWSFAKRNNPLICFSALKYSQDENPNRTKHLKSLCEELIEEGLLEGVPKQIRWEIEWQIAGLMGAQFKKLVEATSPDSHAGREARVLNGSVKAAANLCYNAAPYTNAPFRDRLIRHARKRHGDQWFEDLSVLLVDTSQNDKQREAALFLAGECADIRTAKAVAQCWTNMQERGEELSHGMLFAAVSCLSGIDDETLDSVYRAWEALPHKDPEGKDKSGLSDKRYWVAKNCLSGGLRRVKSERTLRPLIQLAEKRAAMRLVVYGCLEQVDHPLAATFVASHIAEIDKRCEGKDGSFNFLASSRFGLFGSDMDHNVRYSASALRVLETNWANTENEFFFRKRCFQLWRASASLKELQRLAECPPKGLEDELLLSRCRIGDVSAVSDLRAKIEERRTTGVYWFQFIRQFDSRLFEDLIVQKLEEISCALNAGDKPDYSADSTIADILADRRDEFAERVILEHWEDLQHRYNYPHVLLCIATPATLEIHARHFEKVEDKKEYFKLLGFAYGFRNSSRPGITDAVQLEALEPYLDQLGGRLIEEIWDECNEKGFEAWRAKYLDSRLPQDGWAFKQINDEAAFRELDAELENRSSIEMTAYSWSSIRRRNSISSRELIYRANRYVECRANNESAGFLAELIASVGERADLQVLSRQVRAGLLSEMQYEGTVFAVKKRSLV